MRDGLLCREMAIMQPGMFLSHPAMVMQASWNCAQVTVSMLSATISRVCREKRMPMFRQQRHMRLRPRRTVSTHGNCIRHTNRVVLPSQHSLAQDCLLDFLAQVEEMHVARISFPPD